MWSNLFGDRGGKPIFTEIAFSDVAGMVAALAGAGLVAGVLAGLFGIGGGAVLVPAFYQVFGLLGIDDGLRMHLAVGTSLAVIAPTSVRAFMSHRARGAVDMDVVKSYVFSIPTGVVFAALVFASISSEGLRGIFAGFAALIGLHMVFSRPEWQLGDTLPAGAPRFGIGAAIGFLSTLLGIGGGVLNNIFMTLYNRPIHQAVGTSAGVGVLISVPGFIGSIWAGWGEPGLPFLSTGFVNWLAVALIIPVTMIAAPIGVRIAHRLTRRQLKIGLALFMFFVSARFFYSVL